MYTRQSGEEVIVESVRGKRMILELLVKDNLGSIWCGENSFGADGEEEEGERSRMERNRELGGNIPTTVSIALIATHGTEESTLVSAMTVSKAFASCLTKIPY